MRCKPSVPLGRRIWIIGFFCWSTETQAITQLFDILLQVVLDATVCFLLTPRNIWWLWSMFLSVAPFKEQTLIFWRCNPQETLCCIARPAARYKRLYVFHVMDPSGTMKYVAYWMQEELSVCINVCLCVCFLENRWIFLKCAFLVIASKCMHSVVFTI